MRQLHSGDCPRQMSASMLACAVPIEINRLWPSVPSFNPRNLPAVSPNARCHSTSWWLMPFVVRIFSFWRCVSNRVTEKVKPGQTPTNLKSMRHLTHSHRPLRRSEAKRTQRTTIASASCSPPRTCGGQQADAAVFPRRSRSPRS